MPKKHTQSKKTRKRAGKDLDEILEDLQPLKAARLQAARVSEPDPDLAGCGQHYCVTCDRHFADDATLAIHRSTKSHKRRLKALQDKPYSQKEADAAAGLGS